MIINNYFLSVCAHKKTRVNILYLNTKFLSQEQKESQNNYGQKEILHKV